MKKEDSSKEAPSVTSSKFGSKVAVADKPLFNNLRKLIDMIDMLRSLGLEEHISLPRIAVCGKCIFIQVISQLVRALC